MPGQHPSELAQQDDLERLRGTVTEIDEDRSRTGVLIRQLQSVVTEPEDTSFAFFNG